MAVVGRGSKHVSITRQLDTVAPPQLGIRSPGRAAVPAQAYFVGSAVFHYLGPSFAVLLFARVDILGVAWLRIASAAVIVMVEPAGVVPTGD